MGVPVRGANCIAWPTKTQRPERIVTVPERGADCINSNSIGIEICMKELQSPRGERIALQASASYLDF